MHEVFKFNNLHLEALVWPIKTKKIKKLHFCLKLNWSKLDLKPLWSGCVGCWGLCGEYPGWHSLLRWPWWTLCCQSVVDEGAFLVDRYCHHCLQWWVDFGLLLLPVLGIQFARLVVLCKLVRRGRGRSLGASHTHLDSCGVVHGQAQ